MDPLESVPQEGRQDSSGNFVVVTNPLTSVNEFVHWMQHQGLPNASALMRGRLVNDEMVIMVNRSSLIADLIRTFFPKEQRENFSRCSGNNKTIPTSFFRDMPEACWARLQKQFNTDLPRERFVVGGTQYEDYSGVESGIREFLEQLRPEVIALAEQRFVDKSKGHGITEYVGGFARGTFSVLTFGLLGRAPQKTNAGGEAAPRISDVLLQSVTRMIVAFSQQSVLAVPFEIIREQMVGSSETEFHLGEIGGVLGGGEAQKMIVELIVHPTSHRPILSVKKKFRVFAVCEEGDITLFHVRMAMDLDLLGAEDDPVEMRWKMKDAPPLPHTCDCFGASSGYHKPSCPLLRRQEPPSSPLD